MTAFAEPTDKADPPTGKKRWAWFALGEDLPLFAFAGIWCTWHAVRGTKKNPEEGEHRLYGFLTTEANADVRPIHSKAMPAILTTREECEAWLTAPIEYALKLQRPLPNGTLRIVAMVEKPDAWPEGASGAAWTGTYLACFCSAKLAAWPLVSKSAWPVPHHTPGWLAALYGAQVA